ncbi:MAG: hypothetical protein HGA44_07675 [Cellulomonadaceae bacterium]|nr:hypothetical protein [Cellulomonadaceae bacterium]
MRVPPRGPHVHVTVAYPGARVRATGTAVRAIDGWVLVARSHWTEDLRTRSWRCSELEFAVTLHVDTLQTGCPIAVKGIWSGRGIQVRHVAELPPGRLSPVHAHAVPRDRPPGAPGPATDLELQLLRDGTITNRYPSFDGTLRVVADDVSLATRLLAPVYGDALRVERAVFPQRWRRTARAALRAVDDLGIACASGTAFLDDSNPAETVHTIEVVAATEALAQALTPIADDLVRVTSHVEVDA